MSFYIWMLIVILALCVLGPSAILHGIFWLLGVGLVLFCAVMVYMYVLDFKDWFN